MHAAVLSRTNGTALVAHRVLVRFAMLSSGCKGEKLPAQSTKQWDTCVCVCACAGTYVFAYAVAI
jgi:hypothetical protein